MEVLILIIISMSLMLILLGWVVIGLAPVILPITGFILHFYKPTVKMEAHHKVQKSIYLKELQVLSLEVI